MSKKTVDERVVEMRFDNSQFESNVKTSMSTLDKLKQSLKFSDTSKGLKNLGSAANKVDFSGMASGIETVNARFSNLQVIGMTALSNITTAAMNAGASIVKSFTIDPITSGFREYELQMNSIQTILANTKSKGTTMDDVTAALSELNDYADLTIYNFAEMTKNIGTFTAAGIDLDTSVGAIKGIANLGAMSSSTSAQVSTAMYQLSQALATGKVSLMDWNSVVNAGMGGEQFQNALKRTAENFGYDVDGMIKKYGSFRESLTQGGWLTAEVLTETLNQIGGAYDATALKAKGYSDSQIEAILDLAETATNAAQDVKTFTQLMDTLKEAAGSAWARTWQLIFGDFEEAKVFFSGLHEKLEPIVTGPINAMNTVIEKAMGGGESRWSEFTAQLDKAGVSLDSFQNELSKVASGQGVSLDNLISEYGSLEKAIGSGKISADMITKTLENLANSTDGTAKSTAELNKMLSEYQTVVDRVWRGDFANVDTGRIEKLAAAGWDYYEVQKLVNMTVDGHRLTLEDLSAAQIVSLGYTEEQADALVALAAEAKAAGQPMNELINSIISPKKSGRELFLETINNTLDAILGPLQAVTKAFGEVFAIDAEGLYGIIEALHAFSEAIVMEPESLDKLTRTFKGLFGVVKIFTSFLTGTFGFAFNILTGVLDNFNLHILDVTAFIGDALYAFSEWITSGQVIADVLSGIISIFTGSASSVQNFFAGFANIEIVKKATGYISEFFESAIGYFSEFIGMDPGEAIKKFVNDVKRYLDNLSWDGFINGLSNFGEKVREIFSKLSEKFKEIGPDLIEGLKNGLTENTEKVFEFMKEIGEKIIEAIKAVLGIHSPSTVMYEIGQNIVQGLINGINSLISGVWGAFSGVGDGIINVLNSIDWGAVAVVLTGVGAFAVLYKFTDALQMFGTAAKNVTSPIAGIGSVLTSISKSIDTFMGNITGGTKFQQFATAAKTLATAIAILAGAVVVLAQLDPADLWQAVGAIAALAAVIGVLAIAVNKFADNGNALESLKLGTLLMSLAGSMLLLSVAAKIIGGIEWGDLAKTGVAIVAFGAIVAGLVAVTKLAGDGISHVPSILMKLATAFLLLAIAVKLMGMMSWEEMGKAGAGLAGFGLVVAGLIAATKLAGKNIYGVPQFMAQLAISFIALAVAAKIIGGMEWEELGKAGVGILALGGIIVGLMAATKLVGKKGIKDIGSTIMQIGIAFGILAIVARLIAGMTWEDMGKAAVGLVGLGAIVTGLIAATRLASKGEMAKVAGTLLAMSLSIGILAGVAVLLGMVDTEKLVKGTIAITAIAGIMAGLVAVSQFGKSINKGTFIGMAVAIGVLAASVVVLSFIDTAKLASAVIGLSVVMAAFSLMEAMSGRMKKATAAIVTMAALIAIIGGVLYLLSGLPIESNLANAAALSVLLLAMSGACAILQKVGKVAPGALGSIAAITAIVIAIGAVLGIMGYFNVEGSMVTALAISTLLVTMASVCLILSNIKAVSPAALQAMGVLTLVVAGIGLILGLMAAFDVAPSLETALSLGVMLLAMSVAVGILGAIGPLATAAVPAAVAMAEVLGILALVVAAAGAIKQIPGVDWLISEGGAFLQNLGNAIGQFIGGIVGGVLEGATSSLPEVAGSLSDFITNLQPFIDGVSQIDPSVQQSIESLAGAILTLTGAGMLDAITQFIGGESSLTKFAEEIVPFGEAMAAYSSVVSGIDANAVTASATAGKALGELAANLPKEGGLASAIFGDSPDLASFGTQMVMFGTAMKAYSVAITGIDTGAIQASATAGQALAELANNLPKEGGLAQAIFGENTDLGKFGSQLVQFGVGIKLYSVAVAGLDVGSIQNSVAAGQALANLSNSLGENGGAIGWLVGDKVDLSEFGSNLTSFGSALSDYSDSISGIDFNQMSIATSRVQTLTNFLVSTKDMDTSGLDNVKKISDIGGALLTYHTLTSTVDLGRITTTITALQQLKEFIDSTVGMDISGVSSFNSALTELGNANIDGLVNAFSGAGDKLAGIGKNLTTMLSQGLQAGSGFLNTAATNVINGALTMITNKFAQFTGAGKKLSASVAEGITSGVGTVNLAVTGMVRGAASAANSARGQFTSAGRNAAAGFAAGISSGAYAARTAARAMANAAADAARKALDEHSPSKVFAAIGAYGGEGFVNGLNEYQAASRNAGYDMADSARKGLTNAIGRITDLVENGIDSNPTITPVLDLSNVEQGANLIGNMLAIDTPLSTLSSVNSIGRMMNSRNQNGGFDDVVSAVNRLRTTIGDMSRPSYYVNGITYDDGSNIADAVGSLVRAARIERRI